MRSVRRQRIAVLAGVLLFSMGVVAAMVSLPLSSQALSQAPASFVFGAAGDFGANSATAASLNASAGAGTNSLWRWAISATTRSHPSPPGATSSSSAWGASYPFELLVGNHEWRDHGSGWLYRHLRRLPARPPGKKLARCAPVLLRLSTQCAADALHRFYLNTHR